MIFRQLYDASSSSYTYLLGDETSREALLIDPVFEQFQRDLALLRELQLTLKLVVDTHAHADHITAAWILQQQTGCRIALAAAAKAENVDIALQDGDHFGVAGITLIALATPGHTNGCMSFLREDQSMVFTGDALLIRGCGRCDFQEGNASRLFQSITERLFSLPDDCIVYPAHDYNGRTQSSIAEEKLYNPRAGGQANERDFVEYMNAMQLPHPKKIAEALPSNLRSGKPENGQLPQQADWAELQINLAGVPEVTPEWVMQNQPSVTILDVREADEQDASLSGLNNFLAIPLSQLREHLPEIPTEKPIVTLCRSGKRSALALSILKDAGFGRIANIKGGMLAWHNSSAG
ncbi:MAG: MBL fold metallo-hydrolase [Pseudomonadales bacterium]|nr:MBL fold metallo-hydrolase [Pseudomonadales bacterium]